MLLIYFKVHLLSAIKQYFTRQIMSNVFILSIKMFNFLGTRLFLSLQFYKHQLLFTIQNTIINYV